jgi:small subunit ribosomal protein S5
VIAGGPVRAILEVAGVRDVLTKCIGSNNPHSVVRATLAALDDLENPELVAQRRRMSVEDLT